MTQDALRHWRRDLHRHPEAAWCEFRTTTLIAQHLSELGFSIMLGDQLLASTLIMGREIDVEAQKARALQQGAHPEWLTRIDALTGVMGLWESGRPGPTLAFRFDIDAVEVEESQEASHLPGQGGWHSANPGWMHACAHDGHTAIGLVLAERIAALADRLTGRIKLFFQPAEEGCRGGKGGSSTTWTLCWHCTSAFTRAAVSWWSTPPSFSVQPNSTWSSWGKPPMRGSSPTRATMPWQRPAWPPPPCSAFPAIGTA